MFYLVFVYSNMMSFLFTAECVDIWLSKNVKFLEKQEHNIHIFSLGPFIMGLETFISKPWLFCLYDAELLNV